MARNSKMSLKDEIETVEIIDDEVAGKLLIADVVNNSLLLTEHKMPKYDFNVLTEKTYERNIIKKATSSGKVSNDCALIYSFSCAVCQNVCKSCKNICITCKSPCNKCVAKQCKSSSTDTDDFDKYLESLSKKVKIPPKVKTIGTDTCDLEGHFDYYKLEKKVVKIQKHVATDCVDLIFRKPVVKKVNKISIAVDTSDLYTINTKKEEVDESDCEFFWSDKEETKTYSKKPVIEKLLKTEQKQCEDDISINSLVIDEDSSLHPSLKESEDKENYILNSVTKDITFDETTSDESDIDLATSSKVAKCKQLARKHHLKLKLINNETEILYKCSICYEKFLKKHLGVIHLSTHVEGEVFRCLSCAEKLDSLDLLYFHMRKSHLNSEAENVKCENENKENSEVDTSKKTKIFKCTLCSSSSDPSIQFSSSKALYLHKREKHGIEKSKESEGDVKTEKKPRIKREFICLLCGKQFKSSKALKDHSPVHTGEKNYHCDICNKSYTTSANLKIHKRTHTGTRDFVCSVCGKAFHKKDSLKVHFRKHSGERPFQCDLCPMKFDRNYILKNHRYTHFSEKTFICPVCGKTFTTHGGLNNHEKSHKKDPFAKKPRKPAVKPTLDTENAVICDVCGKIYSTKNNLRIHKFVHLGVKPFECTICHQTYAKKDSMLIHMRKHTDERPFACETCGMTFYRNHTLKTHLLRHTGERPHKCKMCGKSFTQSSSLTYHLKNHDKRAEKKKAEGDDATKQKKKRINSNNTKPGNTKKLARIIKSNAEFQLEEVKKSVESTSVIKDPTIINLPDKPPGDVTKGNHFMLPVPEKEILILDKNLGLELPRSFNKDIDYFGLEKDPTYNNQYNLSKFNYYIAKSHIFSLPKESVKSVKTEPKDIEITVDKCEDVENLIISKNSYITKEGNLITVNRDPSVKEIKEEYVQIPDPRMDLKTQTSLPITGEILNAAFISDENGDVVPLGSMTLQGLNSENIMISPFISVENEEKRGVIRNSKLAVVDSKVTYNLVGNRLPGEKSPVKGNGQIINLKDPRISQKIQIELEPHALHIQTPVIDDGTLHGMSGFYNNVQQNQI